MPSGQRSGAVVGGRWHSVVAGWIMVSARAGRLDVCGSQTADWRGSCDYPCNVRTGSGTVVRPDDTVWEIQTPAWCAMPRFSQLCLQRERRQLSQPTDCKHRRSRRGRACPRANLPDTRPFAMLTRRPCNLSARSSGGLGRWWAFGVEARGPHADPLQPGAGSQPATEVHSCQAEASPRAALRNRPGPVRWVRTTRDGGRPSLVAISPHG